MKRYFIGALAITASWVGCKDDDSSLQLPEGAARVPMTFCVSQEPLTRLDYVETPEQMEYFHVAAQMGDSLFFAHNCYWDRAKGDFVLESDVPVYWPNDGRQVVDFYAMNDMEIFPSLFMLATTGGSATIDNHEARLSAWAMGNSRDVVAAFASTRCTADGQVHLNFRHIMAELQIDVRGEEVDGAEYYLTEIVVRGEADRIYHFDTNSWSYGPDADEYQCYYFDSPNGYRLGFEYDELVYPGSTEGYNVFLVPGRYNISVTYRNQWRYDDNRTFDVVLEQNQKNRVRITLPYSDTGNPNK